MSEEKNIYTIENKPKNWVCYMFGATEGDGIRWEIDKAPNWFWRKMQYLLVGNNWVKNKQDE